jgi:prephenate dehydrogenase
MQESERLFKKITIIGVGLIGGSLGLKCKRDGLAGEVVGVGRGAENLKDALSLGAIDGYTHDAACGVKGADLVVLATPVGSFGAVVDAIRPHLMRGALVTDVGSVKGATVEMLERSMPAGVNFVGSHPIAGREKSGAAHADPELFKGARCVLTPTGKTDADALTLVSDLWRKVGARVTFLDPYEHDAILASTSHLPQIAATSLVMALRELSKGHVETLGYCGGGFRDTTRVASSPPEMWRDICLYNREQVLNALKTFREILKEVETKVSGGDGEALMDLFREAKSFRDRLLT